MILSFYGEGKGKTSAALGTALRASGYDKRILFAQFIKGDWPTGEDKALKNIKGLVHKKFGLGFVGILNDDKALKIHVEAAQKGLDFVKQNAKKYDLVILDEIFGTVQGKLLPLPAVLEFVKSMPKKTDIIMTGRPEIKDLLEISDLVSEIRNVKHPFDKGKLARKGIDY